MKTPLSIPSSWRPTLATLLLLVICILSFYWTTAVAMVDIWTHSETFAHAFVVPPITLWLIWRKRSELAALQPRASFLVAIPLAATTFFWLLGQLTAVNALTQFTLVATLVLAIVGIIGVEVSKKIAFPLAFLFFAVPIGDFMMPTLMDWTASFTVMALRFSGIPVYQEGLQFVIPSGKWSVVEACSGIRYIIASVTVGTLFAYLNYVTLRRRIIFIAVSIVVPVVANWLRAYMIVMLGHFSDNKLAAGVDHLIYGWLFFGLVIMVMFMIGARWSEAPEDEPKAITLTPTTPTPLARSLIVAACIAFITTLGPLGFAAIEKSDQVASPILGTISTSGTWQSTTDLATWKPAYANPSAEMQTTFSQAGPVVGVYIGYYRNQNFERKLVTSSNLLTTYKDNVWSTVDQGWAQVNLYGNAIKVRTAKVIGNDAMQDTRLLVWHWYWINGKLTSNDIEAKLYTAIFRLIGKGDDSAVVMLYTPLEQATQSEETLRAFAAVNAENIAKMLQQTRDQR